MENITEAQALAAFDEARQRFIDHEDRFSSPDAFNTEEAIDFVRSEFMEILGLPVI